MPGKQGGSIVRDAGILDVENLYSTRPLKRGTAGKISHANRHVARLGTKRALMTHNLLKEVAASWA